MTALSPNDPTSYSNPEEALVTHLDLNLDVDFKRHVLSGHVHLTVTKQKEGVDTLILDTRDVTVHEVIDKDTGQTLAFQLAEKNGIFGSKLEIKLPTTDQKKYYLSVKYETSPDCSALMWLRPSQTAGKKHPYLYSQCQAIHCRSLIPCQDTPSVKCPYTAKISAPKEIKILMSAQLTSAVPSPSDENKMVYSFQQNVSIPSCLMAIVGGDLVSRQIGPRSKVWSEEKVIAAAEKEFEDTERMLKTAEDMLGPYVWGTYDLLILPPSFPYGGMENPCLTFVTPTLLAGDKSLADVVAHEIAHSWTGNLVTNKTYEHFWLNEGNTKFVERKIVTFLKGGETFRQFLAYVGWNILQETVDVLGEDNPHTRLVPDLNGVDPDDAFSSIPYEKGHALLFYLESLVGGPEVFGTFLRTYIAKFKSLSITTDDWKDFFLTYFSDKAKEGVFDEVDWDGWLYGLGMPPVKPKYDTTLAEDCINLAKRWQACSDDELDQFTMADIESFQPVQVMEFLVNFLTMDPLSHAKIEKLGKVYGVERSNNSEIKFRWLRVCIKARYEKIIPAALKFVTDYGRMKFTNPIYRDLYEWDEARDAAVANFEEHRDEMHLITEVGVAKILNLAE